ncbi:MULTISPECIES: nucleotidyltransferase-like protein [Bacillaceae]|uniref:nucleotidyltransferase-like protein n=1 Tax=Bacillaceae TaxID=186817 RepID=UPI001E6499CB|nr:MULTISPECIES: nucleotidyltransferase-like protein [Bacillaceae]MCE4050162.1 nucleotidyltransferase-like protein [Bacillus sp. Au-Bac7]MCM3031600.1 nucleotidyltransferase-like protein [Niallia sp. MER 6]MDL0435473.1 nucleotidyltransferase-like protein [Niallia sp. SS-2023]UPO89474.1 nucleotidyltransferase-like protein [Niallia sp. Man26]
MEDILRPIYQERASQANTLGVLMIEKRQKEMTVTDTFDSVMLIIVKEAEKPIFIKHYTYTDKKAALHVITETQLKKWILLGTNKKIFEWLYNGRVIFDRNEFVSQLKSELKDFPVSERKRKMGVEFAKLIRRYMDGKAFFENKHYLDAYNDVVHSLHHLARLAVIENGFHPEVTVWSQVKQIEPEIYKLYVELINSEEPLEKRLELLFLASEFLIHSKTKMSIQHISDILEEKEYWSFNDLMENEELFLVYSVDLGMLVEYLIEKHFIEVVDVETKSPKVYHRYYKVSKKD